MIDCQKLHARLPALDESPYPGPLGQRIVDHISHDAWQLWLSRQTMIINEYRLDPLNPKDREQLESAMVDFLFHDGEQSGKLPDAYAKQK